MNRTNPQAFAVGGVIGSLGGLIGLGGAEFRLPVLVGRFRFPTLEAVILNKVTSLPTMLTAFARYRKSDAFAVCGRERLFLGWMIAGSLAGSAIGAALLGIVPTTLLVWGLGIILFVSAVKVFYHHH